MKRQVEPEILDSLPPADPRAIRSRRDLRRLNWWMGHDRIFRGALCKGHDGLVLRSAADLGAGDGRFALRLCRLQPHLFDHARIHLVDTVPAVDPRALESFASLGLKVSVHRADALEWLQTAMDQTCDLVWTNLFLHHLGPETLRGLFLAMASKSRRVICCEPRRGRLPLQASRLLRLIGSSSVTRHDAVVSVRAGFRDQELSAIWPDVKGWALWEGSAGMFSHLFIARRREAAA